MSHNLTNQVFSVVLVVVNVFFLIQRAPGFQILNSPLRQSYQNECKNPLKRSPLPQLKAFHNPAWGTKRSAEWNNTIGGKLESTTSSLAIAAAAAGKDTPALDESAISCKFLVFQQFVDRLIFEHKEVYKKVLENAYLEHDDDGPNILWRAWLDADQKRSNLVRAREWEKHLHKLKAHILSNKKAAQEHMVCSNNTLLGTPTTEDLEFTWFCNEIFGDVKFRDHSSLLQGCYVFIEDDIDEHPLRSVVPNFDFDMNQQSLYHQQKKKERASLLYSIAFGILSFLMMRTVHNFKAVANFAFTGKILGPLPPGEFR